MNLEPRSILERASYWHYRFRFPWGETVPTKPGWAERVEKRKRHFFGPLLAAAGGSLEGKTVLDLGSCQGYWSFECRHAGADSVLGIDSCREFVEEARAAAVVLGIDRCLFYHAHLEEDVWWEWMKPKDVTLILGSLYHMSDPIHVLRKAAAMTRQVLLVDGEVSRQKGPVLEIVPRKKDEPTTVRSHPSSGFRTLMTTEAIERVLSDCGFRQIRKLEPLEMPADYREGRTASLLAVR